MKLYGFITIWMIIVFGIMAPGWCMNVIAIVNTMDLPITGIFVLRCLGIFLIPLGVVMGYFF